MPLRDHFRPPLSNLFPWESFHAAWATEIMRTLNRKILPNDCFAEVQIHVGGRVETSWEPPKMPLSMPAVFPDEIEVQVFRRTGGAVLVAAIELISPRNKDRPESRRAFAVKCASYLQQGVGLVIVDIVSDRQANLHDELYWFSENRSFAFEGVAMV